MSRTPFVRGRLFVLLLTLLLVPSGCERATESEKGRLPAGLPTLVEVGSTQCAACQMMAAVLEELEAEYSDVLHIDFLDVSIPENRPRAIEYGIEMIPSQIFLDPRGKELWRHTGFISKEDVVAKWSELGYELSSGSDEATTSEVGNGPSTITVFYLYTTFRCATCKKVETLTQKAVLGTEDEPSPFAESLADGSLTLANWNAEEDGNDRWLRHFGVQAKIPVVAEIRGNHVERFSVLDQAWFLMDDEPRFLAYMRDAIDAFRQNREPGAERDAEIAYITARDAHARWSGSPESFHILDIRTPEEYVFIGHPEGARNIPIMFMGYSYDEVMGRQTMRVNPDFAAEVGRLYRPEDHLAILGESGPRAALAIRALKKAGFQHLYSVTYGFVGEKQGQAGHPDFGKRVVNGWVNEGVPWTTTLVPELMYTRERDAESR